jgi:hypothetical protein
MDVPQLRHSESLTGRAIRACALGLFGFYLAWNAVWIVKGRIPPSILRAVTGIPCPTTGGFRSFMALASGHYAQSFLFNPLLPVYLLLFGYSVAVLLRQAIRRERLVLRPLVAWMWSIALVLGWAAKFALGRQYW